MLKTELGCASYYQRQYDKASAENQSALELDPNSLNAYWGLGRAYGQKKQYREALDELNKVELRTGETVPLIVAEIGYVLAAAGRVTEATVVLQRLETMARDEFVDPYLVAAIYMGLGNTNATFAALEKAFEVRSGFMVSMVSEPKWDGIRADPRFQDLIRRVGF